MVAGNLAPIFGRYSGSTIMTALFPIILTATQIVLVADSVPKFDVERTCRAAAVSGVPGRDSASSQRDEQDARSKRTRLEPWRRE